MQLDDKFRSEGCCVGDFNHDGKLDIAAGSVYYTAPDWKMHQFREQADEFDPLHYSESFMNYSADLNGDGWTDLIVVGFPGKDTSWYENPRGADGPWKRHLIIPVSNNESPQYLDLNGDGHRVLLMATNPDEKNVDGPERKMAIVSPDRDPYKPWITHPISAAGAASTKMFSHGLGAGDINGDGRSDIVCVEGWWEGPADAEQAGMGLPPGETRAAVRPNVCVRRERRWLARCDLLQRPSNRYLVVRTTARWRLEAARNRQPLRRDPFHGAGRHQRRWAARHRHRATLVVAWAGREFGLPSAANCIGTSLPRKDGKVEWIPHEIDHTSGVGTQFEVADVNGDGLLDIVTSNKCGANYFQQVRDSFTASK